VGLRAGLDTEARGTILCPCRGSNLGLLYGKTGGNKIKEFEVITMDIQKNRRMLYYESNAQYSIAF
jgi:hypothetical protein